MCEWLSCSEWCDVQLLCGGRVFSAHRAVLASVSAFLRKILLSCSDDQSPTVIVLPDFDLEAMSSTLYYIYNGEVVIPKQKLDMFLEIIKALQIFIDHRYLPITYDNVYDSSLDKPTHCNRNDLTKNEAFILKSENSLEQKYINIKKGQQIQDLFTKDVLDFRDKRQHYKNWTERSKGLENVQSPYKDRQRGVFLRDSFIETYPRNGNANGPTSVVPAISNERYRGPSVLLPNANYIHPAAVDISLNTKKPTDLTSSQATLHTHKELNCNQKDLSHNKSNFKSFQVPPLLDNYSFTESRVNEVFENNTLTTNPWFNYCSWQVPFLPLKLQQQMLIRSKDISVAQTSANFSSPNNLLCDNYDICSGDVKTVLANSNTVPNDSSTKVAILNKVLDSPWCPKRPYNYKPFKKSEENSTSHSDLDMEEVPNESVNDNNNNIRSSDLKVPIAAVEQNVGNNSKEASNVSYSIACLLGKEDLKCNVCNQVFTNNDTLTIHMRRHSSTARYTCGECGKTFSQLRNFKYHMSVHRGTREFAATCTVCGKYFNDRGYLSSHMKIHRNRKEYKCSQCPKSFNQRVAYNMHVRIHTGVKPHVCDQCGKAFSRKMLLKQHQRTHSGERPYACPHCDKRFADRSNMTLHLRLHTGVKPFSCSLCPKSFTKKHHLKSHLNFHTGAKPYSCPRCNISFTQSSNMRTHMKKCTAPDPKTAVVE